MRSQMIVGLTGQSGAGKTTVSGIIRYHGVPVIDCDYLSRVVTQKGTPCLKEIQETFGSEFLNADDTLNRKKLGRLVFKDRDQLELLNTIIYPYILREIKERAIREFKKGFEMVVLDAPTLFESGADKMCNRIISVTASEEERIQRIISRDSITREQALLRLDAQQTDAFYAERSDYIIHNDGDVCALKAQTLDILNKIETMVAIGE